MDCAPVILGESVAEPLVVFAVFERLWHVLVEFVDGTSNARSEGMEAFLLIPFDGRQPGLPLVSLLWVNEEGGELFFEVWPRSVGVGLSQNC